ncbi:hypothetical protein GCM10011351_31400 [Paraliobacillus quinghaiensis]|uniref:Uncharacterized protein n=1 Tax=Paraliobacillus quinghaiensis TaxID=470815 RepID=A0A917TYR9_9BACI|nr:hypothetical protein GCM10011351_31400 [Paraliobacillus quinghaiensis]
MFLSILTVVAIYITIYCINYGRIVIKDGNKMGGIAIFCLIPFVIGSPIFFYIVD